MAYTAQTSAKRSLRWKHQVLTLYFALTNPETPFYAKLPVIVSLIYLISPIDLIPDFIPVVGYLDDLIIVPLLLSICLKLLPREIRESSRLQANRHARKFKAAFIVFFIFILLLTVGLFFLVKKFLS